MRVEQACRFRLDGGYCIFAKSNGFGPTQEKALGDVFNDSMNSIFPKMGSSILTCAVSKTDTFLARNTLRTDIHGRMTIFTHAYVMGSEEYSRLMQEDPRQLLSIPLSSMLDSQSPGVQLDPIELDQPAANTMDLDALFRKYNLTPARYSKLLLGAYEAITSNNSLRLRTDRTIEETDQLVRELTYCVVEGLLPVLKGRVTFSSGADTRMMISVHTAANADLRSSDLIFGVEDDRMTNIRPKDEISATAFDALGRMDHSQRKQTLQNMQNWLDEVTNIQEGLSVMLISAAYCLSSGQTMNPDSMLMLFRNFVSASGKSISVKIADSLLTSILSSMNALGPCSPKALSQIAGWYLRDSSDAFRSLADQTLLKAPESICAALVDAALQQPMTDNVRQMLHVLLQRIPPDSPELAGDIQDAIVRWILRENVEQFMQYCAALTMGFSNERMRGLVSGILQDSKDRALVRMEDAVLADGIGKLSACSAADPVYLSEGDCENLDSHIPEYSPELLERAVVYFLDVRMSSRYEISSRLSVLERIEKQYPAFMQRILREMSSGRKGSEELWEHYQANRLLTENMTIEEILVSCHRNNVFHAPEGVFESRVASLWYKCVKAQFAETKTQANVGFAQLTQYAMNHLNSLQMLNISAGMRSKMANSLINVFWETVSYKQIYKSDFFVPQQLQLEVPNAATKLHLLSVCGKMMNNPTHAQSFIDLVVGMGPDNKELQELQACAQALMIRIVANKRYLSWDLMLLACWEQPDKYDLDKMIDIADRLEDQLERSRLTGQIRVSAEDSILLGDPALRKAVIKLAVYELPDLLEDLIDELKNSKKSAGFSGMPRRDSVKSDPVTQSNDRSADPKRNPGSILNQVPRRTGNDTQQNHNSSKGGLFGWKGKK